MLSKTLLVDALSLSPAERIELVEAIWDSIQELPEAVPLTPEQRAVLAERLEEHRRNPTAGSSWEVVKKRIMDRL